MLGPFGRHPDHESPSLMHNVATPPGTLMAPPNARPTVIRTISYGPERYEEAEVADPNEIPAILERWPVTWISVIGLADVDVVRRLGELFGIHPLALEDVLDMQQRPKAEFYPDELLVVLRTATLDREVRTSQFSFIVGDRYVLTFQESEDADIEAMRDRIRIGRGQIRSSSPSYLAYTLVDCIVDGFFPILERYGEYLELLEEEVALRPRQSLVTAVHRARHDLLAIRRCVWPLRDVLTALSRDHPALDADTRVYLRDAYDHAVRLMDLVDNFRDLAASMMEIYLAAVSHRMNEIMKVLTIISTIFIPLGFLAGLYGMNFNTRDSPFNMPELDWRFGYPFALVVMALTAGGMLLFFRRRGWIGAGRDRDTPSPEIPPGAPTRRTPDDRAPRPPR